jgi:4-hydroxy-2-oxoheptanedioate aldolase
MVVVQVESREALACVEEIGTIKNIDVLFIGPLDLTLSMGIIAQFDNPEFWGAVDKVVEVCNRMGIAAGLQVGSMEVLSEAQRRGVRFLMYAHDTQVLMDGYRQAIQSLSESARTRHLQLAH